jgi:MFS family permease
MQTPEKVSDTVKFLKDKGLWLCVFAIFLGGASECTMAQWCSSYLEQAMGIPKVWGDIFGVAMFSVLLGIGRSAYAKRGKNMGKVLLLGAIGATVCYFVAAVSPFPLIGLLACAFTGLCTSMLWPGNLVVAADRFPAAGVFLYAMMAAGGDLGASVAPQLVGVITDIAIESATLTALAQTLGLAPEQFGMKLGMLVGMLFPLVAIFVCYHIRKSRKEKGLEH